MVRVPTTHREPNVTEWGVRWPDDDTVEEHPTEESARRVARIYPCARLVRRDPGPWIPVTTSEESP